MKTKLQTLFAAESKETVDFVMDELGYMPAPAQGSIVLTSNAAESLAAALGYSTEQLADPSGKIIKALQEDVQAAKAKAKREVLAYVQSILDVCALGGRPEMASALIAKEATVEDARAKILAEKAKESKRTQIHSTIGGVSAEGANPLLEDAKKRRSQIGLVTDSSSAARSEGDGGKCLR